MSDGSFDDLARDLKHGFRDFVREMKDGARAFEQEFGKGRPEGERYEFQFGSGGFPRSMRSKNEDGSLVFQFLLPGFEEAGIDLSFKGDMMILKASLPEHMKDDSGQKRQRPFFMRDIDRREFPVPAALYKQAEAKAVLRNGILTVTIPAAEEDMSDAIKVEIVKEGN